ncbi:hypothetical protein [Kitasatospora sp. CB01950]|uniref:hypothetical protein n=1 Tax=Kitasatospora sp. CB01950 TaxID=1703930 RepID=UPI0011614A0D|nr:hypothetical protein [Kitasatospora sp. CB01950]
MTLPDCLNAADPPLTSATDNSTTYPGTVRRPANSAPAARPGTDWLRQRCAQVETLVHPDRPAANRHPVVPAPAPTRPTCAGVMPTTTHHRCGN